MSIMTECVQMCPMTRLETIRRFCVRRYPAKVIYLHWQWIAFPFAQLNGLADLTLQAFAFTNLDRFFLVLPSERPPLFLAKAVADDHVGWDPKFSFAAIKNRTKCFFRLPSLVGLIDLSLCRHIDRQSAEQSLRNLIDIVVITIYICSHTHLFVRMVSHWSIWLSTRSTRFPQKESRSWNPSSSVEANQLLLHINDMSRTICQISNDRITGYTWQKYMWYVTHDMSLFLWTSFLLIHRNWITTQILRKRQTNVNFSSRDFIYLRDMRVFHAECRNIRYKKLLKVKSRQMCLFLHGDNHENLLTSVEFVKKYLQSVSRLYSILETKYRTTDSELKTKAIEGNKSAVHSEISHFFLQEDLHTHTKRGIRSCRRSLGLKLLHCCILTYPRAIIYIVFGLPWKISSMSVLQDRTFGVNKGRVNLALERRSTTYFY